MWEYCGKMALRAWGLSQVQPACSHGFFLPVFWLVLVLVFIGQEGLVQNTAFLNHDSLEGIGALEINRQRLMLYSLRQRLFPAGLLVLASAAGAGGIAVCLFLLWSGFCAGTLLSVLSLRYGIRGVVAVRGGESFLRPSFLSLPSGCCVAGAFPLD